MSHKSKIDGRAAKCIETIELIQDFVLNHDEESGERSKYMDYLEAAVDRFPTTLSQMKNSIYIEIDAVF